MFSRLINKFSPKGFTQVKLGYSIDKGRVREINEDSLLWSSPEDDPEALEKRGRLYVVADGMGGYAAGEVASRIAVETIVREYEHMAAKGVPEALAWAIQIANKEIFLQAQQQGQEGMGTTVVCLALRGAELFVAHAGDSRAYIYRAEQLTQLTQDHTLVNQMTSQGLLSREEAENHPRRHVLTLALGRTETVTPELKGPIQLFAGDTLLLCSDGIAGYLRGTDIQLILQNNPGEPQSAAVALTQQADATGGNDNAVAIVIYVTRVGK